MNDFIKKYLRRINFNGQPKADLETLFALHRQHLYSIPFENMDIHLKRKIILDGKLLEQKLIDNRRGGFCYELNGLFYLLLKKIGFDVKMISACVYNSAGIAGPDFDHMALIVKLENQWLADIGFGDNFLKPLQMVVDKTQKDFYGYFQIIRLDDTHLKLQWSEDGNKFEDQYLFTLQERNLADFNNMCNYHQTSTESHFTQKKVCTIATKNGRITLSDNNLTFTENGQKIKKDIKSELEFKRYLVKYFEIHI